MNNFDNVYCLGIECRKTANTEGDYCRGLEKGSGCIDNIIPSERPEHAALKDAVKGKGSVAACAEVRATLAGNKKYLVVIKTTKTEESKGGFEVYLFSLANGLYNKMGPFPTLDSALSRADCFGLFEAKMSKDEKTRIREAVGDYLYDDEDGLPVYDGDVEDFDGEGYDDFSYDGEMEDGFKPIIDTGGYYDPESDEGIAAEEEERTISDTGIPTRRPAFYDHNEDSDFTSREFSDMIDSDNGALSKDNISEWDFGDGFDRPVEVMDESKKVELFDKLLKE